MAKGSGKAGGRLMRAALQYLRRANKRNRPGRMTAHSRDHVFLGHERPGMATGSGYHYRPGGQDFPGRRLKPGTIQRDPRTRAYTAQPEYFDPTVNPPAGTWKPKGGNQGVSSFFPDHWTPAEVDAAISGAFRNAQRLPNGTWRGTYRNLTIEGYYHPQTGALKHGWPVV
ncbi:EndoU domain-containing protein [Micromonospora chersina]|uniref:EndoU nuclease n=1 Tax=Micromonospora chersina TaxID=47854 RepID=A0A1C6V8C2_9ACTN|nr:EndoU domain-containing protein [Micromonospora chersina]SCL62568.1 EndoU nuclease [Micromonospora chersina]